MAALLAPCLALGACARGPAATAAEPVRPALVFDNQAQEPVHVYLIGERRDWLLGRVAPGARAVLRLPAASPDAGSGYVRLAVLAGARPTIAPSRDPRAVIAIAQPASTLPAHRWTFTQGQLVPLRHPAARGDAGVP